MCIQSIEKRYKCLPSISIEWIRNTMYNSTSCLIWMYTINSLRYKLKDIVSFPVSQMYQSLIQSLISEAYVLEYVLLDWKTSRSLLYPSGDASLLPYCYNISHWCFQDNHLYYWYIVAITYAVCLMKLISILYHYLFLPIQLINYNT